MDLHIFPTPIPTHAAVAVWFSAWRYLDSLNPLIATEMPLTLCREFVCKA